MARMTYGVRDGRYGGARIPRQPVARIAPLGGSSVVARELMARDFGIPRGKPVFDDYLPGTPRAPYSPENQPPAPGPGPAPAQGGTGPTASGSGVDGDYTSDPILLKVKHLAQTRRDDARAAALGRKKQLAIEVGDDALARELGLDAGTAQAAKENPLSMLAQIRKGGQEAETALERELNKRNLFYSGYRGQELGRLGEELLTREAGARSDARGRYSQIEAELLDALSRADEMELMEEANAYARALARRAYGGGGGGAAPSSGGDAEQPAGVSTRITAPLGSGRTTNVGLFQQLSDPTRSGSAQPAPTVGGGFAGDLFPSNPTVGQVWVAPTGVTFVWNGVAWQSG